MLLQHFDKRYDPCRCLLQVEYPCSFYMLLPTLTQQFLDHKNCSTGKGLC